MCARYSHEVLDVSSPCWMEFAASCNEASIFHHPKWIQFLSDCYHYPAAILAVSKQSGRINAGIPIIKIKSPITGSRWVALPFSDYCNPLYDNEDALAHLIEWIGDLYRDRSSPRIEIRWKLPQTDLFQQENQFVLHTIDLSPDPDQVAKRFKRTHLQNVRNAEARGVQVIHGVDYAHIKSFYQLQLETRKRHGVPVQPWHYFNLFWERIIQSGLGFVLLALKEDEIIAGMVFLNWNGTLIAKYAASHEDTLNLRPNNLLFWQGIRWGCENGCTIFDMGRTELANEGLRTFKSRWGSQEVPLFYSYLSDKTVKPVDGKLSEMLHHLIKISPDWVCRASGEMLYRHFA